MKPVRNLGKDRVLRRDKYMILELIHWESDNIMLLPYAKYKNLIPNSLKTKTHKNGIKIQ